jgi:hypothetical protein
MAPGSGLMPITTQTPCRKLNSYPKKPENDAFIRQIRGFHQADRASGTAVLGVLRVTAEQFGDTYLGGCPETTLLSVTDNAHTHRDI